MNRKPLVFASLLIALLVPLALVAAAPGGPAPLPQAASPGCDAGSGALAQIFAKEPAVTPEAPASPFSQRQEKEWCGACLDYDCSDVCFPCGGVVAACAPRCTPICWCYSC